MNSIEEKSMVSLFNFREMPLSLTMEKKMFNIKIKISLMKDVTLTSRPKKEKSHLCPWMSHLMIWNCALYPSATEFDVCDDVTRESQFDRGVSMDFQ